MSQVIFNNRINMIFAATPSVGGYTIGYDLDGVIKQKDSAGIVTPLFSSSSENLSQTLQLGNDSGVYSIVMGAGTSIKGANSNNAISLDYNQGIFISSTASSATASIFLGGSSIFRSTNSRGSSQVSLTGSTYSSISSSATQSISVIQTNKSFSISHNDTSAGNPLVSIISIGSSYDGDLIENKSFVHINSKNANTVAGVRNSAIIGGQGLTASSDDTVYLGNNVNINNEYTLPSSDGTAGQVLTTDGLGIAYWGNSGGGTTPPLKDVLSVGNNSDIYSIVMGTGTGITSAMGQGGLFLDYLSTQNNVLLSSDGQLKQKGHVHINNNIINIGATSGNVTIGDKKGLVYTQDYSATFVANSLVTKQYVDSISNSVFSTYKIAYVDPSNGNDTTALVNRVDKPYQSISKATAGLTSSFSFTSADRGLVHLKKGIYSESVFMLNFVNYYCEPGVLFTGNGFTDLNSEVESSIMGYADFISGSNTNLVPLDITRSSAVNFEFRRIDNLMVALKITNALGTSNIKMRGESIKTQSRLGRGILIGNQAGNSTVYSNVSIDIRESITGAYDVLDVRPMFSGSVNVKCPTIICDADTNTLTGPQIDAQHVLAIRSASASVIVRGDLIESTSLFSGGNNSAVYASGCDLKIFGNIDGGNTVGAIVEGFGTFSVFGNIVSNRESFINNSQNMNVSISDSLMRTNGQGINPYVININAGTQSSTNIYGSRIYNPVADSGMILLTTTHSSIRIYNSMAYSPGTLGEFVYSSSTASVSIHNTRCNKDNSEPVEDIFSPSGFIYDDRFYMEGF